jgi:hypothetical protein
MKLAAMVLGCVAVWAQDSTETLEKQNMKADLKDAIGEEIRGIAQTFAFVGGQMFNGKPVKGQPYSAEAVNETTQTLADGNKIVTRSSTMIYRDSDGRERREETIGKLGALGTSGTPAKVVFISDPVAKVSYTLHSEEHTAEKMSVPMPRIGVAAQTVTKNYFYTTGTGGALGSPEPAMPMIVEDNVNIGRGGASHGKVEQLGVQTIEGVPAEGTRTTTTIPAGKIGNERDINIVSERWVSQELGVLVMSKRSDPRTGDTVYKLSNVNRSEPPRTLFEVPADYTVSEGGVGHPSVRVFSKDEQ